MLAAVSFIESSVFPVPPDVMLAPMSLAQPERAWRFALLTTVTSVIGGVLELLGWKQLEGAILIDRVDQSRERLTAMRELVRSATEQ